jgi:hypothetical protein
MNRYESVFNALVSLSIAAASFILAAQLLRLL